MHKSHGDRFLGPEWAKEPVPVALVPVAHVSLQSGVFYYLFYLFGFIHGVHMYAGYPISQ